MPKAVIEEDFLEDDDDRDDIEASGDEVEELEEAEEEEEPEIVVKNKASKPAKVSSKVVDADQEVAPKKAVKKAVKKAASDEDAEEHPKSKGKEVKKMATKQKEKAHRSTKRGPILAGFFSKPKTLHAKYHGKELKATVSPDGVITFKGKTFTSPSGAGSSIREGKSKVDGWHFWKIQNAKGELVTLDTLRQKKSA